MTDFPPYSNSSTSHQAAGKIAPTAESLRQLVLRSIVNLGGATCDELEVYLDMKHQTVSARIWELRKRGLIRESGAIRKTRGRRNAIVWARCQ